MDSRFGITRTLAGFALLLSAVGCGAPVNVPTSTVLVQPLLGR
jgi:hypothetical protein